jgi:FAD/FMN-containing dehydrogenase
VVVISNGPSVKRTVAGSGKRAIMPHMQHWPCVRAVARWLAMCAFRYRLADCVLAARRQIDAAGLLGMILGHVGDGNFHSVMLVDPDDPNEIASAKAVTEAIVDLALSFGGTSTGEHGIGIGKKAQLAKEHGEAVDVMRALKLALDPYNIMNPGKIFDFAGLAFPVPEITLPRK